MSDEKLEQEAEDLERNQKLINAENEKFAEGKVHFRSKLYRWSDQPAKEFKKQKTGLEPHHQGTKGRGLILPSEEVMNCPKNRAKVEKMYKELAKSRESVPDEYSSVDDGKRKS